MVRHLGEFQSTGLAREHASQLFLPMLQLPGRLQPQGYQKAGSVENGGANHKREKALHMDGKECAVSLTVVQQLRFHIE